MKKLFLMLLFIAGINAVAHAQMEKKSPEQRAAHETKSLQKMLNLTSDQADKINVILLNSAMKMDSLQRDSTMDKKGAHLGKKSIKITTDQQVMGVLNNDQQKQYMEIQAMKKEHHQNKQTSPVPVPAPASTPSQG